MMAQIHYLKINNPIPTKWRDDTTLRLPFPSGASGSACSRYGSHDTDMVVTGERR
jgi:hypothetical protein